MILILPIVFTKKVKFIHIHSFINVTVSGYLSITVKECLQIKGRYQDPMGKVIETRETFSLGLDQNFETMTLELAKQLKNQHRHELEQKLKYPLRQDIDSIIEQRLRNTLKEEVPLSIFVKISKKFKSVIFPLNKRKLLTFIG